MGEVEADQVELFGEEVHPLESAEAMLAKKLLVRLPSKMAPDEILSLKEMVSESQGSCQLSFELRIDDMVVSIDAGKEYMVKPTREFLAKIASLVGSAGVELQ